MCFGKKTPSTPLLSISGPISVPFDYEKHPLAPWQNAYSTHVPQPIPTPPPKVYSMQHGYSNTPKPVPNFDTHWRQPDPQSQRKESSASSYYSRKESLASQYSRKESFGNWSRFQRKGTAASVWSPLNRAETGGSRMKSPLSPSKKWKLPMKGGKNLFRNAGLDEHGRLKLDYENLSDEPDWGEPEEYVGHQRRPSVWD
ncbi:hypothetical protein MMC30_002457 [Trapelia coarctata]|nr:hypothetical protein [Trapelia coarctata]